MGANKMKEGGGSKLSRTETVTVRLDPQLRYLVELAARKQRRTVSSFIEWALEESLSAVVLKESAFPEKSLTVAHERQALWDVDEADRLAKLAFYYPELLTHDGQVLWKLIRENDYLWKGRQHQNASKDTGHIDLNNLIFARLREHWGAFNDVARGKADISTLPKLTDQSPPPTSRPATSKHPMGGLKRIVKHTKTTSN